MTIEEAPATKGEPKNRKFKKSLARSMAIAMLFFAMIPVSIMGITGYLRARYLLQEQTALQIHSTMYNQTNAFDTLMNTKEIRLERASLRFGFREAAENLIEKNSPVYNKQLQEEFELVNNPKGTPLFAGFFLINPDGVIYAGSDSSWLGTLIEDAFLLEQVAKGEGSVGIYNLKALFPQEYIIFTIRKLSSNSGEDLGILVGVTREETTRSFLNETMLFNPEATAYIISANKIYLEINPYTEFITPFTPTQIQQSRIFSFLATPISKEDEKTYLLEYKNNYGTSVVAQVHQLASINSNAVLEVPREVAYGQLGSLGLFTFFLFLSTLLVLATVLLYASDRIVAPIQDLSKTAHKFAAGNWSERAPVKRYDEIGELEYSFNQMADELRSINETLRQQVDERTEYIRTASDVAQSIVATFNLDELLEKTTRLIAEKLDYYHVGIFMVGQSGKTAYLRAAHGPAAKEMLLQKHHLDVGSSSIVGWVSANNRHRATSDVGDDPVHFKNELLPNTHAEIGLPISVGDTVLGVLDVQSTHPEAFDEATIETLITLSNQIATAIQNVSLFESSDVNLHELDRLHRASHEIAQKKTREEVFEATGHILQDAPFSTVIFISKDKGLEIYSASDPDYDTVRFDLPEFIDISPISIIKSIKDEVNIIDLSADTQFPKAFVDIPREMGSQVISLLPMTRDEKLEALIMIGARHKKHLTYTAVQPYINFIEMVKVTLDKIQASDTTEKRLAEMEAISIINQATATVQELSSIYPVLHEQVRQILGDYPFIIALYDKVSDTIDIPYAYENGEVSSIPSFPLGEGLTSIIVHTGEPLMIVENTKQRIAALGAKVVGATAKSWIGSPMKVKGEVIGAIIVQDTKKEKSFDKNSLRFINTLASQVSGAIYNIQLLEDSRQRAIQLKSAAEIARDISGSLHLDELLSNAVTMIRERFNFYHASVFLIDPLGEYAIIREATGEAGAQLKRNGHKLRVGSKSIVGYVSNRGENLVIEDTNKDATYYANPLLPETRAEAGIPLKVGERILGVLDIQSVKPYAFHEEILQTLSIIADQLAIAVINTELFAETQEHLSQHRLLHHITTSAASGTTLEESLRGAVQGLHITLGGDRVAILLLDDKGENLIVGAAVGYSEEDLKSIKIPIDSGVTGWVARNKKLLRIDDTQTDTRYISVSANTRSELAIPLIFRRELLGVLNVESEEVAAYDEYDEEILGTLVGSLAAIIANTRLIQRVRRQAERERMLYEATSKIRRSANVQTILSTAAKEIIKATGAEHTQVKIAITSNQETKGEYE